jgi:predicted nucleic acid-binding protein
MAFNRRARVFLDTSALIAGVLSRKGAAYQTLKAAEAGLLELMVSADVLIEADRNMEKKFPALMEDYRQLIEDLKPILTDDPTIEEIQKAGQWIEASDAVILAAAIKSLPDYLVTWNTKDFMSARMPKSLPFKIMNPPEFIAEWSAQLHRE